MNSSCGITASARARLVRNESRALYSVARDLSTRCFQRGEKSRLCYEIRTLRLLFRDPQGFGSAVKVALCRCPAGKQFGVLHRFSLLGEFDSFVESDVSAEPHKKLINFRGLRVALSRSSAGMRHANPQEAMRCHEESFSYLSLCLRLALFLYSCIRQTRKRPYKSTGPNTAAMITAPGESCAP